MHWCQARLRTISDQDEHERQFHDFRIQPGGDADERCPAQTDFANLSRRRVVHQHGSHEGQSNSDRRDDQVLVGGFQTCVVVMNIDQEHRRQCRAFDGHPHDTKVVRRHSEQHGEHE